MSNIIAFPPIKPPFLEVGSEAVDGYTHVIRYRDERYKSMVFRRCMSKREALAIHLLRQDAGVTGKPTTVARL